MGEPVDEDGDVDPGSITNAAHAKAIEAYELLFPLQAIRAQSGTAGLFHLFEQITTSLGRAWIRAEWPKNRCPADTAEGQARNGCQGGQPMWPSIRELELAANVIKHGDGRSVDELRGVHPGLFEYLGTYGAIPNIGYLPVVAPLGRRRPVHHRYRLWAICRCRCHFWIWLGPN